MLYVQASVPVNVGAFLMTLSKAEGTYDAGDAYRVCFGFTHLIQSFRDHPYPVEWAGGRYANGKLSTAAGAFQINHPTFVTLSKQLRTSGFMPEVQCDMAVQLFKDHGAFDLINAGDIISAIGKLNNTWASLAGGSSGQPERTMAQLLGSYLGFGGKLA